jgi:molybdenum cofactor synthesis domain-containing protein
MRGSEVEGGFPSYVRLAEALKLIFSELRRLPSEKVGLAESLGRVSASEVAASADVPPFDRAAVDGYAVRAQDTVGASELHPTRLRVVGSCVAGRKSRARVRGGQAVEISTGAPLPAGADAVVPVEKCRREGGRVMVLEPVPSWKNVSRRGEDVGRGETILRAGKKIGPADIGLLAACGYSEVEVSRRPTVSVIPTGSELEEPGKPLRGVKIYNSNSYSISAAILESGGVPFLFKRVGEEVQSIRRAIRQGLVHDMVVLTGGSSVGKGDLVPSAVAEEGRLFFHGVAIRPGSPTSFGVVGGKPVFSLPGFPAGCLIAFDLLVRPAIHHMLGCEEVRARVRARLARGVASALGRVDVVRVRMEEKDGRWVAHPLRVAGSSILSSISKADGFILIPEEVEKIEEGTEVEVVLYR